jgi:hypothetical protein
MMTMIRVTGHITKDGKLEVELPAGLPPGEVEVMVQVATHKQAVVEYDDTPFTLEEIAELLIPRPVPTKDIITGGWEDVDLGDSAEWVEKIRQQEENNRRLQW